jgi:hypothetical protein
MAKHEAKLIKIYEGPEKEINIFVHGFRTINSLEGFYKLARRILAAKPRGRAYLLFWKSGKWSLPGVVGAFLTLFTSEVAQFKHYQHQAEVVGKYIKQHIGKIPEAKNVKINFIGHSFGARVICFALAFNDWSDYRIRNCILLGGEVENDPALWLKCVKQVNGKIYNIFSKNDEEMKLLTIKDKVGTSPIRINHPLQRKIENRDYYTFGHHDYWKNLNYIFRQLEPGYKRSKQFDLKYCCLPLKQVKK